MEFYLMANKRKKPIRHLKVRVPESEIRTRIFFGKKFLTVKVGIPYERLAPHLPKK